MIPASLAAGIKFQNERERAYFRLYQDEVSSELASGFDSTLWNQIVLQACEDPSILGLTTAIAALRKAGKLTRMGRRNRETNFHIEEALKLYGKALKGIRIMLSKGQRDDLRIVLIAALLIFCVENLHGDTKQAMRHIQTTLQLIQQKLRLFAPGTFSHYQVITNSNSNSNYHIGTPLSVPLPGPCQSNNSLIEDEIMQPFSTNFCKHPFPILKCVKCYSSRILRFSETNEEIVCVDRRIPVLEYGASAARFFLEHRDVPEQFFTIAEARNFADRIRCQLTTRGGYVFETFEREDERVSCPSANDSLAI